MAFEGVLKECNRLAQEYETQEQKRILKSKLFHVELDYQQGLLDEETYRKLESEILRGFNESANGKKIENNQGDFSR